MRVPRALLDAGPLLLLQPRRAAARAVARRIATERGWTIGREIGWQIRFERRFSRDTCLLVATEGILTARLQQDPLLSTFNTVVLDEFYERSLVTERITADAAEQRAGRIGPGPAHQAARQFEQIASRIHGGRRSTLTDDRFRQVLHDCWRARGLNRNARPQMPGCFAA